MGKMKDLRTVLILENEYFSKHFTEICIIRKENVAL